MATLSLSVVMSVYNSESFLAEAIESVLGQTFSDFEFVIVDDGSTDRSTEILAAYARRDPRIRLYRQENRGVVDALNRGCDLAQGACIARMDADDIALPDRLSRQMGFLAGRPAVALIGGAVDVIDPDGRRMYTLRYPVGEDQIKYGLPLWNCFAHPTIVMRTDAFRVVGGYRKAFLYAEDYDLWLRLAERYDVANLAESILLLRTHGAQVTGKYLEQQVLSALAAQAAARRRRESGSDGLDGVERVTAEVLERLGIKSDRIHEELIESHVTRAADLVVQRHPRHAAEVLESLLALPWAASRRRHVIARFRWACARNYASLGQTARGAAAAVRAVVTDPALVPAWVGRKIRRMVKFRSVASPRRVYRSPAG